MTLKKSAFTLIELTLVTVIILALAGLSIPLFKRTFSDLSAKDAAFNISKLAGYAQEKSIINRKRYKISFDLNRRNYQMLESQQTADALSWVKEKTRFGKIFTLPLELSFYDPETGLTKKTEEEYRKNVIFYPDGHCDKLSIGIIDKSGVGYGVTLNGFGLLAKIKEIKLEQ